MSNYYDLIQKRLSEILISDSPLRDAMEYSVMAGGKRLRPILAMEFCAACGEDPLLALDAGCAIELSHTYSLIHDDLPCMDNDSLRRGKPTCHVVYGECTATLAGDALQSLAFETILNSSLSDRQRSSCALVLAKAIGWEGMCYGQYLDMEGEGKNLTAEELDLINLHKTGDLISASCQIGCICAGADEKQIQSAGKFGFQVGLAFQIRDDILDVISSTEELGKPVGSDAQEHKNTYFALLGQKRCQELISSLSDSAISVLEKDFTNTDYLKNLVRSLETRVK